MIPITIIADIVDLILQYKMPHELAKALGVTTMSVWRWRKGYPMSMDNMIKLYKYLRDSRLANRSSRLKKLYGRFKEYLEK